MGSPGAGGTGTSQSPTPPTSGIVTGKCQAITLNHTPCKFQAKYGRYCGKHRPPSPSSSISSSSSSYSRPPTHTDAEIEIEKKMRLIELQRRELHQQSAVKQQEFWEANQSLKEKEAKLEKKSRQLEQKDKEQKEREEALRKEAERLEEENKKMREENRNRTPEQVWEQYHRGKSVTRAAFKNFKKWCREDQREPASMKSILAYYAKDPKPRDHRVYSYDRETDQIGNGSFGTVYKALNTEDNTYYALKFPGPENADSDDLKKEIAIIGGLEHPHIVRFYGFVINDQQQVGIVMEYMKGGSLYHRLHEATPPLVWTVKQKRDGVLQLLQALTYLHGRDIVHCDLKSANVLLKSDSVDLYLCDFGLTLKNGRDSQAKDIPVIAGTPLYMAPELFRSGIPPADLNGWKCADIYALCSVIGEIVTGKKPHAHLPPPRDVEDAVLNSVRPFSHEDLGRVLTEKGIKPLMSGWNGNPIQRANLNVLHFFFVEEKQETVSWLVDPP
jgi:hypothetical protein